MAQRRLSKHEQDDANRRAAASTMDDEGIKRMMASPKWQTVLDALKAGDDEAFDVVTRATALFNEGGVPVWDPKKKRTVTMKRSSAPSAKPISKGADAPREINMNERVTVKNLAELAAVLKQGAIEKKMRVFMPKDDGSMMEVDLDAAEELLERMAGTGSSSEEMYPTPGSPNFRTPSNDSPNISPWPKPYGVDDDLAPGMTRVGPSAFLSPNADPNIARPAPFDPSEPGRVSTNPGADPMDFREDSAPLTGSVYSKGSPVMKSDAVKPGTFKDCATNLNVRQQHEA